MTSRDDPFMLGQLHLMMDIEEVKADSEMRMKPTRGKSTEPLDLEENHCFLRSKCDSMPDFAALRGQLDSFSSTVLDSLSSSLPTVGSSSRRYPNSKGTRTNRIPKKSALARYKKQWSLPSSSASLGSRSRSSSDLASSVDEESSDMLLSPSPQSDLPQLSLSMANHERRVPKEGSPRSTTSLTSEEVEEDLMELKDLALLLSSQVETALVCGSYASR